MRRADREIKEFSEIIRVMEGCDVCRIALNGEGYPYILPLNFGMSLEGERVSLYFHGAAEGTKYALIAKDDRASFEMDRAHKLILDEEDGNCTMEYESVIGRGRISVVPEEEKLPALGLLMSHYRADDFIYNPAAVPHTTILRLDVESMTGKTRIKKR